MARILLQRDGNRMNEPLIVWFRRDLRLGDHPMLAAALATGRPLLPVFVLDPETEALGAAAKWRLGLGIEAFAARLQGLGARLILRRGPALPVLRALIAETGAAGVMWSRLYDRDAKARDAAVKAGLRAAGRIATSHPGHLLHEPWQVQTGQGGDYKVYSPFWRAIAGRDVALPAPAPQFWPAPQAWPVSDRLQDWALDRAMQRGAAVVRPYQSGGEPAALDRLARFLDGPIATYKAWRDYLAEDATSGLSENRAWGEIGPRVIWHGGQRARHDGAAGAEHFLKELAWREFAYHLLHHAPDLDRRNWRAEWDSFPWAGDSPAAEPRRRGRTGEPIVDAAMREMYVTGRMHNRARMIVASYLTKHLLTDWRIGLAWFADCLTDWDPAANAMGWQWVAGSGPDAAPYFRVFNPATQAETWDPNGRYRRRWLAEGQPAPPDTARAFFRAVPKAWSLDPTAAPPRPIIDLATGRQRALAAYAQRNT
jgi:deoxyribodipyrimidine photo-lyase